MRRASRDRFAAILFFLRRAQYLSSFKSSGTNCGRKRKIERKRDREGERQRKIHKIVRERSYSLMSREMHNRSKRIFYLLETSDRFVLTVEWITRLIWNERVKGSPASVISWSSVEVWAPRRRRPECVDRSLAPMRPSRALQETSHIVFVTSPRNLLRGRGTIDNVDVSLVFLWYTRQARRYRDMDSETAYSFSLTTFCSPFYNSSLFILRIKFAFPWLPTYSYLIRTVGYSLGFSKQYVTKQ